MADNIIYPDSFANIVVDQNLPGGIEDTSTTDLVFIGAKAAKEQTDQNKIDTDIKEWQACSKWILTTIEEQIKQAIQNNEYSTTIVIPDEHRSKAQMLINFFREAGYDTTVQNNYKTIIINWSNIYVTLSIRYRLEQGAAFEFDPPIKNKQILRGTLINEEFLYNELKVPTTITTNLGEYNLDLNNSATFPAAPVWLDNTLKENRELILIYKR